MIKQLKLHEADGGVYFNYGTPGETQGSWILLDPMELENGDLTDVIHEANYNIEAVDPDEYGAKYVYYNYLVHQYPVKYVSCDHFQEAVEHLVAINAPLIDIVRVARVQLNYCLHDSKVFAEGVRAGTVNIRSEYLKAKTRPSKYA